MDAKAQIQSLREIALTGAASRAGLNHVIRALEWAAAYVGKGISEGVYAGTAVSAERALTVLVEVKSALSGTQSTKGICPYINGAKRCQREGCTNAKTAKCLWAGESA